jgi:hypothetical protein
MKSVYFVLFGHVKLSLTGFSTTRLGSDGDSRLLLAWSEVRCFALGCSDLEVGVIVYSWSVDTENCDFEVSITEFSGKKNVWNCSRGIKTIHKDKRGSYKQSMKYVKKFQYWNLYGVKGDIKETEINFNRI